MFNHFIINHKQHTNFYIYLNYTSLLGNNANSVNILFLNILFFIYKCDISDFIILSLNLGKLNNVIVLFAI